MLRGFLHRTVCIVGLGDNNCQCIVQLQVFSQFIFLPLLSFPFCLLYVSIPIFFLPTRIFWLWYGVDCAQTGHCGPHLHNSSHGILGNDVLLLLGAELPRTIGQEIAACFGGAFSALGLFILSMAGAGMSFLWGELAMTWQQINFLRPEKCWAME